MDKVKQFVKEQVKWNHLEKREELKQAEFDQRENGGIIPVTVMSVTLYKSLWHLTRVTPIAPVQWFGKQSDVEFSGELLNTILYASQMRKPLHPCTVCPPQIQQS